MCPCPWEQGPCLRWPCTPMPGTVPGSETRLSECVKRSDARQRGPCLIKSAILSVFTINLCGRCIVCFSKVRQRKLRDVSATRSAIRQKVAGRARTGSETSLAAERKLCTPVGGNYYYCWTTVARMKSHGLPWGSFPSCPGSCRAGFQKSQGRPPPPPDTFDSLLLNCPFWFLPSEVKCAIVSKERNVP